jgi:hypothetical protein
MSYTDVVKKYLVAFQKEYIASNIDSQHTAEMSFRPILDAFLRDLARTLAKTGNNIQVILEPKNQNRIGRPDWRIHNSKTMGVYGYIEAKPLASTPIDIERYVEQIGKYLTLGHNLIITDGIEFTFFMNSSNSKTISMIDKNFLFEKDWAKLSIDPTFEIMMTSFFSDPKPYYCDEQKLVEQISVRTRMLSNEILKNANIRISEAFPDEKETIKLLNNLKLLIYNHDDVTLRNERVFSDFVAQVIMFSLLYAHRVLCLENDPAPDKEKKIKDYISSTVQNYEKLEPFRKLMLYILNNANNYCFILSSINEAIEFLSFVKMTSKDLESPDYHKLFELFLSKFDPKSRFDYGAFYTPKELASFVLNMTEKVVQESLGSSIFLDDNTIIDPCCGTGSFLEQLSLGNKTVAQYDLYGFEILPAPYMLANYRMSLIEKRHPKNKGTRIVLTNTLSDFLKNIGTSNTSIEGEEYKKAKKAASRPIKLIIGNPPSSDSFIYNKGKNFSLITKMMEDFRPPHKRRQTRQNVQKQVSNLYMQFLRWGCDKTVNSKQDSVLSFIIPSSFLESESYKYARAFICDNFSDLWVLNIDADARTGIRSDSLFNTLQGRCLIIAIHKHGMENSLKNYNYLDISSYSLEEKKCFFNKEINSSYDLFSRTQIGEDTFSFVPEKRFDKEVYDLFWPISGVSGSQDNSIFKNHCSGIKLAPTALFTHIKEPLLKRRTRELMREGKKIADFWFSKQQKPPSSDKIEAFHKALVSEASDNIDALLDNNIFDYSFRPFLSSKVLLWNSLLKKYARVEGGGTRLRPELIEAYKNKGVFGFSMAHAPKDLNPTLTQFSSFCWYYPDNDMCTRGNSHVYLNKYPIKKGKAMILENNINDKLLNALSDVFSISADELNEKMVFYIFAILSSQVYLDTFEGALFTVHNLDKRARIPITKDSRLFNMLVSLGKDLAGLERADFIPENILKFDHKKILEKLPEGFYLNIRNVDFDELHELIKVRNDDVLIEIPCPVDIQRKNISGYDVVKNVWLKFYSFEYTNSLFNKGSLASLLNLLNKLALHGILVGNVDIIVRDIINKKENLLQR